MRTVQTSNIVNQYHKVKVIKDFDLIEIDQGIFGGKPKSDLTKEEKVLKKQRSKDAGMETYQECFQRAKTFVNKIKINYNFENILIITHNCVATFIEDVIENKEVDFNNEKFLRNFDNAEVKKFVI